MCGVGAVGAQLTAMQVAITTGAHVAARRFMTTPEDQPRGAVFPALDAAPAAEDAKSAARSGEGWSAETGAPSQIRVVRSLDPGGLDDAAIKAAREWKFMPGRMSGTPVPVLVTVVLDFTIR